MKGMGVASFGLPTEHLNLVEQRK